MAETSTATMTQPKPTDSAATAPAPEAYGLLAEFGDVDSLLAAATKVRQAGYRKWDCFTPFPVHGLDKAMGVKATILPWIVFGGGLTGFSLGIWLQWWTNAVNYPFLISGKPFWSIPANVPVIFELTILFSALSAVFGMFALNKLPQFYHPVFHSRRFKRVTQDRFFIAIEAGDGKYDSEETGAFLESLGATAVEELED